MNLRTKIISKYKNECPATLNPSWLNKNTNHQDTRPYYTSVCRAISGLMIRDDKVYSMKNPIRKGEWCDEHDSPILLLLSLKPLYKSNPN